MIKKSGLAVVAAVVATAAGCSGGGNIPDPAPSVTGAAPSASAAVAAPMTSSVAPPAPVKAPTAADGELARRVMTIRDGVPHEQTTIRREPNAGQEYMVRAACADEDRARTLTYVVKVGRDQREFVRGEFPCDGNVRQDGIGTLERGQVLVYLEGEPVESGYAVIVPLDRSSALA